VNQTTLNVTGNIYASNALTTTNISATSIVSGTLYYGEDLAKRSPYILATPSNAAVIQAWISATCNAAARSWWATTPGPVFGLIASGRPGTFGAPILLPDGRVLFPSTSSVGFYNPSTLLFSTVSIGSTQAFSGGVLAPSGNVILTPSVPGSNIGMFNPVDYTYSNIPVPGSLNSTWSNAAIVAPSGNVVFVPRATANIIELNPVTFVISNVLTVPGTTGYMSGCLLPSGNIVFAHGTTSDKIGIYNPATTTFSTTVSTGIAPGFSSAVLGPDSNVIFGSTGGSNISVFSPSALTVSNVLCGTSLSGSGVLATNGNIYFNSVSNIVMLDPVALRVSNIQIKWTNGGNRPGRLVPGGRIIFSPDTTGAIGILNMTTPAPVEFCISPYFNKF